MKNGKRYVRLWVDCCAKEEVDAVVEDFFFSETGGNKLPLLRPVRMNFQLSTVFSAANKVAAARDDAAEEGAATEVVEEDEEGAIESVEADSIDAAFSGKGSVAARIIVG